MRSQLRLLTFSEMISVECIVEANGQEQYKGPKVQRAKALYEKFVFEGYNNVKYTKTRLNLWKKGIEEHGMDIPAIVGFILKNLPAEIKDVLTAQMLSKPVDPALFNYSVEHYPDYFTTAIAKEMKADVQVIKVLTELSQQPKMEIPGENAKMEL